MPRTTRFQRDRIARLIGQKTKPIQKSQKQQKTRTNPFVTPSKKKPIVDQSSHQHPQQNTNNFNSGGLTSTIAPIQLTQPEQSQQKSKFKSSSYLHIIKVHKLPNNPDQIQKLSFKCYDDADVYGEDHVVNFLKQDYDNDNDTPEQQVKYHVSRGIRRLKEEIEKKKLGIDSDNGQSQKGANSIGSTPPRYIRNRNNR